MYCPKSVGSYIVESSVTYTDACNGAEDIITASHPMLCMENKNKYMCTC